MKCLTPPVKRLYIKERPPVHKCQRIITKMALSVRCHLGRSWSLIAFRSLKGLSSPISSFSKLGTLTKNVVWHDPSTAHVDWLRNTRCLTLGPSLLSNSKMDVSKEVNSISDKFGEALELLNEARSSVGTVYFSEDMKDAEQMVEETLSDYKNLLAKLNEKERTDVQRTIGLKMEELAVQLQIIKDSLRTE